MLRNVLMGLGGVPKLRPRIVLFDFAQPQGVGGWRVLADHDWGGKSEASVAWHQEVTAQPDYDDRDRGLMGTPQEADPRSFAAVGDEGDLAAPGSESVSGDGFAAGFLRFKGTTSLERAVGIKNAGFCATKSPYWRPSLNLEAFPVLAMRVRTEGRRLFTINVEPESFIPDDLYQGFLRTPPGRWVDVEMSFRNMVLTSRGRERDEQRAFDSPQVLSLGLAVADGQQGPFQMDVAWIAAVLGKEHRPEEHKSLMDL
ncbi:unnamed protein product [Phaeothamnion confervicola]